MKEDFERGGLGELALISLSALGELKNQVVLGCRTQSRGKESLQKN